MTVKKKTSFEIEQVETGSLVPYARNSRTHSDEQVAQIMASIREFGFTNPVLIDGNNGIIAGHGRVMAASRMNLPDVPCLRLAHLTEAQKRAYIIADNKLGLNSGWDTEMLAVELSDLHADEFDLGLLGFDADELSDAMGDPWTTDIAEIEKDGAHTDGIVKALRLDIPVEHFTAAKIAIEAALTASEIPYEITG